MATTQVNGKTKNSTPHHAKTPKNIFTKIGMRHGQHLACKIL